MCIRDSGTGVLKRITEEVLEKSEFIKDFYADHNYSSTIGNLIY